MCQLWVKKSSETRAHHPTILQHNTPNLGSTTVLWVSRIIPQFRVFWDITQFTLFWHVVLCVRTVTSILVLHSSGMISPFTLYHNVPTILFFNVCFNSQLNIDLHSHSSKMFSSLLCSSVLYLIQTVLQCSHEYYCSGMFSSTHTGWFGLSVHILEWPQAVDSLHLLCELGSVYHGHSLKSEDIFLYMS